MENENQIINLGSNVNNNIIPGVAPINATIEGQAITNTQVDVSTLNISSTNMVQDTIQVSQQQANMTAAAQVVTPTTTINDVAISEQEANINSTVVEVKAEGTPVVQEAKFILNDEFIVNTEMFKSMIAIAKKAATCIPNIVTTTIFDITFDNDCLKIVSTDSYNVLVQTNRNIGFKNTLHFNIEVNLFSDLISKLDCETIKFELDERRYVKITTSDGSNFMLPEFYDRDSGQIVTLERMEGKIQQGDIEIDVDGIQFKQLISSAKTLTANEKVAKYLAGIYCADRIYSTDSENMFGLPNIPQLTEHPFYINNELVERIVSLDFSVKTKIVLRPSSDNPNNISHVIIADDNISIDGPCNLEFEAKYPTNIIQHYMTTDLPSKFTIERSKLESVLKVAELFIEPNTDKENCIFTGNASNGYLEVRSRNEQAHQYIPVTGLNVDLKPFYLRVKDFLTVLGNCSSDIITVEVDSNEYVNIRITDNNFVLIVAIQHNL